MPTCVGNGPQGRDLPDHFPGERGNQAPLLVCFLDNGPVWMVSCSASPVFFSSEFPGGNGVALGPQADPRVSRLLFKLFKILP